MNMSATVQAGNGDEITSALIVRFDPKPNIS